jgi:outer membrane protein TolC
MLLGLSSALALTFGEAVDLALGESAAADQVITQAVVSRATARIGAAYPENPEASLERRPGETTLLLVLPVEIGAVARGAVAQADISAANLRERAGLAAVACAAGSAYLDALHLQELALLAAHDEGLSVRLATAAQARLAAGEFSVAEGALLRAEGAKALDHALSTRIKAEAARRVVAVLTGRADATVESWPQSLPLPTIQADSTPGVLAATADARAALAAVHAEQLSLIPRFSLLGGWGLEGHVGPVYGASIELPLFATGAARVAQARGARLEAEALVRVAIPEAEAAIAAARDELAAAEAIEQAWAFPGLEAALLAAETRFARGESSVAALVAERDAALSALESAAQSRWRAARARLALYELAGEIPKESPP